MPLPFPNLPHITGASDSVKLAIQRIQANLEDMAIRVYLNPVSTLPGGTNTVPVPSTAPTPSPAPTPAPAPSGTPAPTPTPAPVSFTSPSQTTGLELWFDAGDAATVTAVSGNVSQINDKTANAHNATQATAGNRPIYASAAINSLNVIDYNGSFGKSLTIPHSTNLDNLWAGGGTMMAVINMRSAGTSVPPFSHLIDKGNWSVGFSNNGSPFLEFVITFSGGLTVWNYAPTTQWSYGGGPFLLEVDYNSSATTNVPTIAINGVPYSVASNALGAPSGTYNTDAAIDLTLGSGNMDGQVAALYFYPATMSATDRANMRAYVSSRWNIGVSNTSSTTTSTTPTNPNTPVANGGAQPATAFDLASASVPGVIAQQGQGWSCVGDYTFGTAAGTIKTYTDLFTYCATQYDGGVARLNDEWELYVDATAGNHLCHVFATDHLKLRAIINDSTLYNAQVARCQASVLPAGQTPDNHDWGSWQGGRGGPTGYDCGVQSGMLRFLRTQKYGYFEWKTQVPPSTKGGAWPANWMIECNSPTKSWPPEVDVLEMAINNAPDNSFNSFHNCAESPGNNLQTNVKTTITGLLDQFGSYHGGFDQSTNPVIYGCLWQAGDVRGDHFTLYVNQVVVWEGYYPWRHADNTVSGAAQFLCNLAFGGNWPGRLGAAANSAVFPVDYPFYYFRQFAK